MQLKQFAALILFSTALFSCSENFLDRKPVGALSENIFYNEKGIDGLLISAYALTGGGGSATYEGLGSSVTNWTFGSAASDDAYVGAERGITTGAFEIEEWHIFPYNNIPEEKWRWYLMGVTRVNGVLRVLKATKGLMTEKSIGFEAEARFLRAWFNFEAWLVFKNIVIITEETEHPELVPNTGDVMASLINDLIYAIINLPETQEDVGRPTRYAAMALLARAHLQTLNYAAAKPLLDNILNSGKYSLMPNFHDNYDMDTQNNEESVFEIQASVDNSSNSTNVDFLGIWPNFPHGSDIGMCCGLHQPSQNLVNAFKVDTSGLPMFDTFNDSDLKNDQGIISAATFVPFTDEVDPRLDWTVSRRGIPYFDWGVNRGRDWIRYQEDGGPYLPASKFFFEKKDRYVLSYNSSTMRGSNANNFRAYRLGHIILWRAEVAVSENDLDYAEQLVNMIRRRAGNQVVMGRVTTYELPVQAYPWNVQIDWSQPAANYRVSEYPTGTFTDKGRDYAMRAVQWELRLEFATEGHRFFDLRRWGIITETLNAFALGDLRIRSNMKGKVFTDKAKYAPIPQTQIKLQPGVLVQNPGY